MLMKKENIEPIIKGQKFVTLRKPTYKIKTGKRHKFVNSFSRPWFADAFVEYTFLYDVRCMTDEFAYILGFDSAEDYMNQGYNKNEGYMRLAIVWSDVQVNPNY